MGGSPPCCAQAATVTSTDKYSPIALGCRPVADVYRSCEVLNQRAMGPQLRQPRRDGGHNVMTRHVSRMSFVQAIGDPIDRRRWYCPPVMSPARLNGVSW